MWTHYDDSDVSHKHAEYHMNKYIQVSSNDITFLIMLINFMNFCDVEQCCPCSIHFSSVKSYNPHINLFTIYATHNFPFTSRWFCLRSVTQLLCRFLHGQRYTKYKLTCIICHDFVPCSVTSLEETVHILWKRYTAHSFTLYTKLFHYCT